MDTLDAYIQEITSKHGMVVKKGDPVLILHTFLDKFEQDLHQAQEQQLQAFVSVLEAEQTKWLLESKSRADAVLNAALEASAQTADSLLSDKAKTLQEAVSQALAHRLQELEHHQQRAYHLAIANMIGAGLLAAAVLLILLMK